MKNNKFPKDFLWGASTSSHQIEGNTKNQWTEWEKENARRLSEEAKDKWQDWQKNSFPEMFEVSNYISGKACDHYNRFEEDFDLAKEGGHNAYRFSIEWSRIEPEEGIFNEAEIEHYRKVIQELKKRKLEPFICLWHWTNPLWLGDAAETRKDFPFYFSRYAKKVVESLGQDVKFWMTINEPTSVIASGYVSGSWPPGKKSVLNTFNLYKNLSNAHNKAYEEIKNINPRFQVGFANILHSFQPYRENNWLDILAIKIGKYFVNERFLNLTLGKNDFLTVQYYFHHKLKFPGKDKNENSSVSDMGWEIYPEGIYHIIKDLKKHNLPIYVTENGLADADDSRRIKFIAEHIYWVKKAIDCGADVRGYFYWSLLDNFEWDKGFWPRFGLIEIDYKTLERKPRKSFWEYKKIIEKNSLG